MKTLLLLLCLTSLSLADDLRTRNGTVYRDYHVTSIEGNGIRISHRDGNGFIDYDELPSDVQSHYGWTEEKSNIRKGDRAALLAAQQAAEAVRKAAQQKARDEAAKAEAAKEQRELAQKQTLERLERLREENAKAAKEEKEKAAQRLEQEQEEYQKRQAESEELKNRIIFWSVIAGFLFVNFIPTMVAKGRSNSGAVLFVNMLSLMIGVLERMFASEQWQVIAAYASSSLCWFIALIMAFRKEMFGEQQAPIIHIHTMNPQVPVAPRVVRPPQVVVPKVTPPPKQP